MHKLSVSTANNAIHTSRNMATEVHNGAYKMCDKMFTLVSNMAQQSARDAQAQLSLKNQLIGAIDSISQQV